MREIVLDTETTGLDPNSGHRIVEIGAIELVNQMRTGNSYHIYINPERDMPLEAFNVHGISEDFLKGKPVMAEIVGDFMDFIGDSQMVIHNAGFDMKFINWELQNLGFKAYPMARAIDTVGMARKKFPGSPVSLDALCKRFDIDLSARTKHGALLDAELLADVYIELLGGKQVKLSFGQEAEEKDLGPIELTNLKRNKALSARAFTVADHEQQAHQALVAEIKDSIWANYKDS